MNTSNTSIKTSNTAQDCTHQQDTTQRRTTSLPDGFQMIEIMPTCVIPTEDRVYLSMQNNTAAASNACTYVHDGNEPPILLQHLDADEKMVIKKPASKEISSQKT